MSLVELFRRFAHPLNELALPYMATGAVAAIVYGEPRLTLDLDLVLKLVPGEAVGFAAAFPADEFYVPPLETIVQEAERGENGHFNLLHHASGLRADIYLASKDPLDVWGLAHRRVMVRKLEYFRQGGSTKHLSDIRAMLRIRPDLVALPTLTGFIQQRGLDPEWKQVSETD